MEKGIIFRGQKIGIGDIVRLGDTWREWGIVKRAKKFKRDWKTGKNVELVIYDGKIRKTVFLSEGDYSHDVLLVYRTNRTRGLIQDLNDLERGYWNLLMS